MIKSKNIKNQFIVHFFKRILKQFSVNFVCIGIIKSGFMLQVFRKSVFLIVLVLSVSSAFSQNKLKCAVHAGYSPVTEDRIGFGISYRPEEGRWLHALELYPLQNRGSDITIDPVNFGASYSVNYVFTNVVSRLRWMTGAEVYAYRYKREILGTPGIAEKDFVMQPTLNMGLDLKISRRFYINARLPVIGLEYVNSNGSSGRSNHTTPLILGFFGFFQPKLGLDVMLF